MFEKKYLQAVLDGTDYEDSQTGIAYWQWANSLVTENYWNQPSVKLSTPDQVGEPFAGYLEFSYWLTYYCSPDNEGAMSPTNWALF